MKENYVAYDYVSINVKNDLEPMYRDCYENFGWIPVSSESRKNDYYINSTINISDLVTLKFKRDRKINNKAELQTLQRKCESAFEKISKLEKEPGTSATTYSLSVATVGIVFMAISVFSITGESILWIPAIIGGLLGIIGWILPFLVFKKIKTKKTEENVSKIEEQYNIIYDTCEEGRKLITE